MCKIQALVEKEGLTEDDAYDMQVKAHDKFNNKVSKAKPGAVGKCVRPNNGEAQVAAKAMQSIRDKILEAVTMLAPDPSSSGKKNAKETDKAAAIAIFEAAIREWDAQGPEADAKLALPLTNVIDSAVGRWVGDHHAGIDISDSAIELDGTDIGAMVKATPGIAAALMLVDGDGKKIHFQVESYTKNAFGEVGDNDIAVDKNEFKILCESEVLPLGGYVPTSRAEAAKPKGGKADKPKGGKADKPNVKGGKADKPNGDQDAADKPKEDARLFLFFWPTGSMAIARFVMSVW